MMSSMGRLSDQDEAILQSIFNPNQPLGELAFGENSYENEELQEDDEEFDSDLLKAVKALEVQAVQAAERGELGNALTLLEQAVDMLPDRASGYNNRAQVHRLRGNHPEALKDLSKAISFGKERSRTVCQALCQRGSILRKLKRDEEAREDFQKAAQLGSVFARGQLVELNPYAALCNQMLSEVIGKLK